MGSRINFEMVHEHLAAFEQIVSKIHYNLENQIQLNQFERCYFSNETDRKLEQAGTGPSRRHIQGSKNSKKTSNCQVFSSTVLEIRKFFEIFFSKIYIQKIDRVARRGPLARAPGALKGGHVRNCQHFCRS